MTDDITLSQVSSVEYTAEVQLEMSHFSSVYVFGAGFHYNTFLVRNRKIG